MKKLKLIIALILIIIPLILGIVIMYKYLEITPFDFGGRKVNIHKVLLGDKGSYMMPVFYGLMLLSGVILLKDSDKK